MQPLPSSPNPVLLQVDLAGEQELAALEARIRGINGAAALVRTQRSRVDLARVLHCGAFSSARATETAATAADERGYGQAAPAACSASHPGEHGAGGAADGGEISHMTEAAAAASGHSHAAAAGAAGWDGRRAAPAGNDASSHQRAAPAANGVHPAQAAAQQHAAGVRDCGLGTSSRSEYGHRSSGSGAAGSGSAEANGAARHVHDSGFATVSVRLSKDLCLTRFGLEAVCCSAVVAPL